MKKVRYRKTSLIWGWRLAFAASIFFLASCNKNTEFDFQVEEIHYLNNTPVKIGIKDGKITAIQKIKSLSSENDAVFVAPGLIDNQVNGYRGYSFVDTGQELTLEGIETITSGFWEAGITTYMPTITTNDHHIFLKNFKLLATAKEDIATRGSIAGFHLEGPYISPVDGFRGAHPLIHVRKPNWDEFMELYEASGRNILQITLAPEVDGALDFISRCKEMGIKVGLGHHNASSARIAEAIDRGAIIATHLGNGIAN